MQKHVICLDWLELMVQGELVQYDQPLDTYEYAGGKYALIKRPSGTQHFKYCYEVYQDGRIFAKVLCSPRNPEIIKPDLIQVKLENSILYERSAVVELQQFLEAMEWKVRNVTRLDIAIDGVSVLNVIEQYCRGVYAKKGKASITLHYTGQRQLQGFDIGKRSSDKWVTGYCKSDELEKSNKHYIKKFWQATGLDLNRKIERLELKLRNEEIKKIAGFDWRNLDDFTYLSGIFKMLIKNYFEFYDIAANLGVKNSSRIKTIQDWIDWDDLQPQYLNKLEAVQATEIYRMKLTAKQLYWTYLSTGGQYYADIAQEMALNANCIEWYIKRIDTWKKQYDHCAGKNRDGLIKFKYMTRYKQYGTNEQLRLFAIEQTV